MSEPIQAPAFCATDVLKVFPAGQLDMDRSVVLIRQIMHFSEADLKELSRAQDVPVCVDEESAELFRTLLIRLANLVNLIAEFFSNDIHKVELWFTLPNYFFGNSSPRDMIRLGRYDKVLNFVVDALEENELPSCEVK